MDHFQRWMHLTSLAVLAGVLIFVGCAKKYSTTAVSPFLPTATVTPTPAPATPTATSTPCNPASVQTSYTFENNIECWHVDAATSIVTSLGFFDNQTHNDSAGSLQASVSNNTGDVANAKLEVSFAAPQNMYCAVIHLWVYVGPGLAAPDWTTYLLLYDRNSGVSIESVGLGLCSGADANTGQWHSISLTVGSFYGSDPTHVSEIGVILTNIPAGASGNFYIDDVTITYLPTPTPTPATTCEATFQPVYTFDSSLECWRVNATSQPAVSSLDIVSSPARNGAGCMRAVISEPSEPVTVQLELQYSEPQTLSGRNFIFWVYVDPSLAGCAIRGFTKSRTPWYENTGSWTEFYSGNVGQWVPILFTTCFCGGNANEVHQIGLQIFNLPASASGNVYVDDFQVVPYLCSAYYVAPAYGFESSYDCWQVNPASLPIVYAFDLSTSQSHEGVQSLHLSVSEPSSPSDLLVSQKFNYLDFTGKNIGLWVWVDSGLSGCSAEIYTVSGYDNIMHSGDALLFDSSNTGRWVFMSWTPPFDQVGEVSTLLYQMGLRFTGLPASASGDIYIDDVTIP